MNIKLPDQSKIKLHSSIDLELITELIEERDTSCDNPGVCMSCGEIADSCEPDAQFYTCDNCDRPHVMAPEELLMRGWHN